MPLSWTTDLFCPFSLLLCRLPVEGQLYEAGNEHFLRAQERTFFISPLYVSIRDSSFVGFFVLLCLLFFFNLYHHLGQPWGEKRMIKGARPAAMLICVFTRKADLRGVHASAALSPRGLARSCVRCGGETPNASLLAQNCAHCVSCVEVQVTHSTQIKHDFSKSSRISWRI